MPDVTLSEAIREAYATAPAGVVTYHTIEIRHSTLTEPIRLVRDTADLTAYLEADAPEDPGAEVTFLAYAFDFQKPEVGPNGSPYMPLTIDNVGREITIALENAVASTDVVYITYREYLSTDLTGPQNDPPIHMELKTVNCNVFQVSATAGFPDRATRRFPTIDYTTESHPGLAT